MRKRHQSTHVALSDICTAVVSIGWYGGSILTTHFILVYRPIDPLEWIYVLFIRRFSYRWINN